jgi:hypothetical protein
LFQNFKIETLIREKYNHYYNNNIELKWTPIEPIIKNIRIGKFQSFIMIQFRIQLVVVKTIHCFQGLSLNEFILNPLMLKNMG